jgi:hypothetical protein
MWPALTVLEAEVPDERIAMTTLAVPRPTVARTAVTAAGLTGAVASAALISTWFLQADVAQVETARTPVVVVANLIAGLSFAVLAVSLPLLGPTTRLPRWSLTLAGLACAFIAVPAWTFGTVLPHLAGKVGASEFDALGETDFTLLLLFLPMILLSIAAFGALAVVGWRRHAMSRGASVLLIVAAVASLMVGTFAPLGVLAGLALAWTAHTVRPVPEA